MVFPRPDPFRTPPDHLVRVLEAEWRARQDASLRSDEGDQPVISGFVDKSHPCYLTFSQFL
jgi:hypothetical protein